jgi:prepilin-type N-terminal cleavage/methylation domain-containing protein
LDFKKQKCQQHSIMLRLPSTATASASFTIALANRWDPSHFDYRKPILMEFSKLRVSLQPTHQGFSLVEMLVVIAVITILMTAGAIGLGNMGGKSVTSAVASAESLFDEARSIAISQHTRARVLVALDLTNNPEENLRKMVVVSEQLNPDGTPIADSWILSNRGILLPDKVFLSQTYSMSDQAAKVAFDSSSEMTLSSPSFKSAHVGKYRFYEFNAEGICTTPGASFVIASGARGASSTSATERPRLTASAQRDFGGFVIWRNGRTAVFRSPEQIHDDIKTISAGAQF